MADGLLVLSEDSTVVEVNATFSALTGFPRASLVGTGPPFPWWPPGEAGAPARRAMAGLLRGEEGTAEMDILTARGDRIHIEANRRRLPADGPRPSLYLVGIRDISDRVRLREALRDEADFLQGVLAAMGEGLVALSPEGRVVMVNDAFCDMTGFRRRDLVGRTHPLPWWPAEHAGEMTARIGGAPEGRSAPVEAVIVDAHGRRLPVEVSHSSLRGRPGEAGGRLIAVRDIADRRRAEDALRESEERLRVLIENQGDGLLRISPGGAVLDTSPSAARVLGYPAGGLPGSLTALVHPDDRAGLHAALERARGGGTDVEVTARFRTRSGGWRWIEAVGNRVPDRAGHAGEVLLSVRDVSARIHRERDLAALHGIAERLARGAAGPEVFATVAAELARVTEADAVAVVRFAGDIGRIEGYWARGEVPGAAPPHRSFRLDAPGTASGRVWRTGGPVTVRDVPRGAAGVMGVGRVPLPSMSLGVPIRVDGVLWGSLAAAVTAGAFPDATLTRMARFADIATLAVSAIRDREALERSATVDELTGLANRRMFDLRMGQEVSRARRHAEPLALVMLDIDHFKVVNDTHGHAVGDRVLRRVAAHLRDAARAHDTVARIGGEELAWILPGAGIDRATDAAERLRAAIGADPGDGVPVTASFGVADLASGDDPEALVRRADVALYRAKRAGRDRVVRADEGTSAPR